MRHGTHVSLGPESGPSVSLSSKAQHPCFMVRRVTVCCRGTSVHGMSFRFLMGRWLTLQCNQCSFVTRFGTQRDFTAQNDRCKAG